MFQVDGGVVYAFLRVLVVGADKGIAEVPGMPGEQVVVCIESYGAQVLYEKHGSRPRIAFAERVYLPQVCGKFRDVGNHVVPAHPLVAEEAFLREVVVHGLVQVFPVEIADAVSVEHPFLF